MVHLAAQAGVRYSLENPHAYVDANLVGFLNVLEGCRHHGVQHLVYASTSSVYGANTRMPFSVHDNVDHPVSLYAASKKANELMAHTYSHLYRLPTTGLRFFTVYGPWGRPDMALFIFTKAILEGRPIRIFNEGRMQRDFTYIDDIVEGVRRVIDVRARARPELVAAMRPDPGTSTRALPALQYRQPQPGRAAAHDRRRWSGRWASRPSRSCCRCSRATCRATFADIDDLTRATGFRPATPIEDGIAASCAGTARSGCRSPGDA